MTLDCDEIIPGRLWIGGYVDPGDIKLLGALGITTLISLQSDEDLAYYGISIARILRACEEERIDFRRIAIPDFDQVVLAQNLPGAVAVLESALAPSQGRVYLHCSAGINRSPTAAAAYLIRSRGFSAREAHDFLISRRNCSPYLSVLERYEISLRPGANSDQS
jgi:protein-tyrosine phosphatase